MSNSLWPHELQHARPPCPSPTPGVHPNPCPSSQWCHPNISSSVISFTSCPQSFPASGSFQMSQLFTAGGQSIGVSVSTSVLPMNTQDWSLLVLVLAFINNVHELKNKKKKKTQKNKHNSRIRYKYLLNISLTPLSCRATIWVSLRSWFWLSFGSVSPWHPYLLLIKDSNSQPEYYINDFKFSVSDLISYIYRDEFAKNTTDISWPCIVPTVKREGIDWGKIF